MARSSAPLAPTERVLLIRLGAVGDVLRTLPALHLLRSTFPSIFLAWIVEDRALDILEGHPEIDEVIRFPRAEFARPLHVPRLARSFQGLRRELRKREFDVAIDFQGTFKSSALSILSGARRRIGLAPGHCREMSFLFTNEWVRPPGQHLSRVLTNLLVVESVGATGDEVRMVLPERPEEAREAALILQRVAPAGEPVVLLAPGASSRQAYKMWPADRFVRLALMIRQATGAVPLVAWGPGEESLARTIVENSGGTARMAPPAGLRLLAALLRRSALFIGADSGPMHLAWGVGCPVVALFGPTDPRLNAPLGAGHVVVRRECAMDAILAEDVLAAARDILARGGRPPGPRPVPRLSRALLFPAGGGPS